MTDVSELGLHVRHDEGCGPATALLHGINSDVSEWRKVIGSIGEGIAARTIYVGAADLLTRRPVRQNIRVAIDRGHAAAARP